MNNKMKEVNNSKDLFKELKIMKKGECIILDETKANPYDAIKSYEELF